MACIPRAEWHVLVPRAEWHVPRADWHVPRAAWHVPRPHMPRAEWHVPKAEWSPVAIDELVVFDMLDYARAAARLALYSTCKPVVAST